MLRGRCGTTCKQHCTDIAVCHYPDIDPTITYNLDDNEDARCQVCHSVARPASMLLCDDCNHGYHLACLQPKLTRVPKEEFWYCPRCLGQLPDDDLTPDYLAAYEERGKQLDGRRALKVIEGSPYEGTVEWLGAAERPYAFRLKYDDGDRETFTLAELQQLLLPEGASEVQKREAAARQAHAQQEHLTMCATWSLHTNDSTTAAQVDNATPEHWNLATYEGVRAATSTLMPGPWTPQHITNLAHYVKHQQNALEDYVQAGCPGADTMPQHPFTSTVSAKLSAQQWGTQIVATTPDETRQLVGILRWFPNDSIWNPYSGFGSIPAVLRSEGQTATSTDIHPAFSDHQHGPVDALQPAEVRRFTANVVITSPIFKLLDIAIPLAAEGRELACFHTPLHYVFDAHPSRRAFLRKLSKQGRLHILLCRDKGPLGRRNVWVIIANSPLTLQRRIETTEDSCTMTFAATHD
eukprot:gene24862-30301_t